MAILGIFVRFLGCIYVPKNSMVIEAAKIAPTQQFSNSAWWLKSYTGWYVWNPIESRAIILVIQKIAIKTCFRIEVVNWMMWTMSFLDTMKGQFFISINIEACSLQLVSSHGSFCMERKWSLKKNSTRTQIVRKSQFIPSFDITECSCSEFLDMFEKLSVHQKSIYLKSSNGGQCFFLVGLLKVQMWPLWFQTTIFWSSSTLFFGKIPESGKCWDSNKNRLLMATRNPAFTHQLRLVVEIPLFTGFGIHPRWLFGISSINSIGKWALQCLLYKCVRNTLWCWYILLTHTRYNGVTLI